MRTCSHVICGKPNRGEKFLSGCASGRLVKGLGNTLWAAFGRRYGCVEILWKGFSVSSYCLAHLQRMKTTRFLGWEFNQLLFTIVLQQFCSLIVCVNAGFPYYFFLTYCNSELWSLPHPTPLNPSSHQTLHHPTPLTPTPHYTAPHYLNSTPVILGIKNILKGLKANKSWNFQVSLPLQNY